MGNLRVPSVHLCRQPPANFPAQAKVGGVNHGRIPVHGACRRLLPQQACMIIRHRFIRNQALLDRLGFAGHEQHAKQIMAAKTAIPIHLPKLHSTANLPLAQDIERVVISA